MKKVRPQVGDLVRFAYAPASVPMGDIGLVLQIHKTNLYSVILWSDGKIGKLQSMTRLLDVISRG